MCPKTQIYPKKLTQKVTEKRKKKNSFKTLSAAMSHHQPNQDATNASAPNPGEPHPPPRGPPGTGTEAGLEDDGKWPRPNLIHTYLSPTRASRGILLVDYPDSPGSDSTHSVPDQASPVGRPGSAWPNKTPEKSGLNESNPDFPGNDGE